MVQSAEDDRLSANVILIPAVITLAVTLLRLIGELQNWSPALFSRAPGGGGSLVGISWLVPVFGIYFGLKLARAGYAPRRVAAGIGLLVLAIALLPLTGVVAQAAGMNMNSRRVLLLFCFAAVVAGAIGLRAWPPLGRILLQYGLAARVPVAIVILLAIYGNWGTHYDAAPPGVPAMSPFVKWLWLGLLPQMTLWIAYTIVVGGLFGLVTAAIAARRRRTAPGAVAA
jgi:hypothetical protein